MNSLPAALLAELEGRKDFSMEEFLQAHELPPAISIRINPVKISESPFPNAQPVPWNKQGFYLAERPSFTFDPLFHAGAYYVQEASSMFIGNILKQVAPQKNVVALDLCAAPGGKTTLLASYFSEGLVVGNEVIKSRANILSENAAKWGIGNIIVTNNDPKQFAQLPGFFDLLLVDAPCSGSGLFRREKEWRDDWTEENVTLCSQRQQRILADSFETLKTDGILIYSTCSYSQAEDEAIVDWICENFEVESIRIQTEPEWGIVETESDRKHGFGYRFFPHLLQGEGFFVSVFRKKTVTYPAFETGKTTLASKEEIRIAEDWVENLAAQFFFKQNESILFLPAQWRDTLSVLQKKLYLKKAGVTLGEAKVKGLVPAHDLALSIAKSGNISKLELTKEQALCYLRKQDFEIENKEKHWLLATYQGIGLGWLKILPNRINNYYPTEWRILKTG